MMQPGEAELAVFESLSRRPCTGREAAALVLARQRRTGQFASELLNRVELSSQIERMRATDLTLGTVRRQLTLTTVLGSFLSRPWSGVEPGLQILMTLGAGEVLFLRTPEHAAVSETVELARRIGRPRWTGFLNGVLRQLSRETSGEEPFQVSEDAVPIRDGVCRRIDRAVFSSPETDFSGWFSQAFGLNPWLAERWSSRYSTRELVDLGNRCNEPAAFCLRVNTLVTTRDRIRRRLLGQGIEAKDGSTPESVRLAGTIPIRELPGHAEGWLTVQDESAMGAAVLLDPKPGESVLDLCAAPGTKTTHLAERMTNSGRIVATDVNASRLGRIESNSKRLGIRIVEPLLIGPDGAGIPDAPFDAVLADVPCTNSGVLARRPEARRRLDYDELQRLVRLQRRLLKLACLVVRPGGRVVYSTCSIEPEENEQLVRGVCEEIPEITLRSEQLHFPGKPGDGAYQALLARQ